MKGSLAHQGGQALLRGTGESMNGSLRASVALQADQNIVVVSKRLGHSNVSITSDIYAHSLPGWQRQAADAFAAAMEEGDTGGQVSRLEAAR